jgi:hypothetical protein
MPRGARQGRDEAVEDLKIRTHDAMLNVDIARSEAQCDARCGGGETEGL